MLLPFAGFLYGSVLNIETLSRSPLTAWLTHFVLPVLTLGILGPALVVGGLLVFAVGAGQIYVAKLRKTGLVTRGLYRFVRHPQYVALTLFGTGILLTWGRAIAWISFFGMMLLYYHLSRHEERRCRDLFGEGWERYRERTSFVLPGDRHLRGLFPEARSAWLRSALSVAIAAALCAGSLLLVTAVKRAVRTVPFLEATIPLPGPGGPVATGLRAGDAGGIPYVTDGRLALVRGPWRTAAAPGFAERALPRLRESPGLRDWLAAAGNAGESVIGFGIPWDRDARAPEERGAGGRGPEPDPHGPDRATWLLFRCAPAAGGGPAAALADPEGGLVRGACLARIDLARPRGEDVLDDDLFVPGPAFPGAERWRFVRRQVLDQIEEGRPAPPGLLLPGTSDAARLLLVKAPILRTRRDPAFAGEILDRLVRSERFAERLAKAGAGGGIVPLAFPRPGDNWYREHHGTPRISVFVILARLHDPAGSSGDLFRRKARDLLGAFTMDMDFAIPPEADSVDGYRSIGLRRDLEERFEFFLSGV